ncbi:GIY-YIG nuclease family protein [Roseomonas gilardii]|uniref:GIY-YIG nuclease family protein n=1 Tax=Roseomonas gilardii TaxID=257708 RepID=UPI0012EC2D9D|nr:GIY-YIG nuclease family protein [Roseomonas gilardii]
MADELSMLFLEGDQEHDTRTSPQSSMSAPMIRVSAYKRKERNPYRSSGKLSPDLPAWVYVACTKRGKVKIGMSNNPERRVMSLKASLMFVRPVTFIASRDVESRALDIMGRLTGQSEWVHGTVEQAIEAVNTAWDAVSRYKWTDPALTEVQARKYRIALAMELRNG